MFTGTVNLKWKIETLSCCGARLPMSRKTNLDFLERLSIQALIINTIIIIIIIIISIIIIIIIINISFQRKFLQCSFFLLTLPFDTT